MLAKNQINRNKMDDGDKIYSKNLDFMLFIKITSMDISSKSF